MRRPVAAPVSGNGKVNGAVLVETEALSDSELNDHAIGLLRRRAEAGSAVAASQLAKLTQARLDDGVAEICEREHVSRHDSQVQFNAMWSALRFSLVQGAARVAGLYGYDREALEREIVEDSLGAAAALYAAHSGNDGLSDGNLTDADLKHAIDVLQEELERRVE